jgi:hypothetical protein
MKNKLWLIITIMPYTLFAQIADDKMKNSLANDLKYSDTMEARNFWIDDTEIVSYQNTEDYYSTAKENSGNLYPGSAGRFTGQGFDGNRTEIYFDGLMMNDIKNNSSFFNTGLNGAFRQTYAERQFVASANSLAGIIKMNYLATHQARRSVISCTHGNGAYANRLMLTHHSGPTSKGWAYSLAMSKAWAAEGYRDETFSDKYAWYLGISKKIKQRSTIHFFTLGTPGKAAGANAATQEAYDLAGSIYYNPSWGYQNGEKRNANITQTLLPLFALQYEYKPDSSALATLTVSYQAGYKAQSGLDWYNAPDPRPDYYKRMPSYYSNDPATQNFELAEMMKQQWMNDPYYRQINWDNFYQVNEMSVDPLNVQAGRRSAYVLGADREDSRKINMAASFEKILGQGLKVATGFTFIRQRDDNYRQMLDLLGGDYYVNLNQFAEQSYAYNSAMKQIDLDHPDQLIRVGDTYGYHYLSSFTKTFLQTTISFSHKRIEAFITVRAGFDSYSRNGIYRNGLFPDSSKGKSEMQKFFTHQLTAGMEYKISNSQSIWLRATLMNAAPIFNNVFISPKTKNNTVSNVAIEKIQSAEIGYQLHLPMVTALLTAFANDVNDGTQIRRFYYEGDNTFVNYVLQHIDVRRLGFTFGFGLRPVKNVTVSGTASLMQAFYRSNPEGSLYRDNDTTSKVDHHIVYLENYSVASGPQSAYSLSLQYYSPKRKFQMAMTFNSTARNYVELNPMRHTNEAIDMLSPGSEQYEAVLRQEMLPSAFTADVYAGKTFRLQKVMQRLSSSTVLNISFGINNLLNRKDIRIFGSDQLRFDYESQDPQRFPTKYTYAQGLNYFVGCRLEW